MEYLHIKCKASAITCILFPVSQTTHVTTENHDYTDINDLEENSVRRNESSENYQTIRNDFDRYDHCRPPPVITDTQTDTPETYDSLNSHTTDNSVIGEQPYDTTRDNTYDRLHSKEKSSVPGNYDVLPI